MRVLFHREAREYVHVRILCLLGPLLFYAASLCAQTDTLSVGVERPLGPAFESKTSGLRLDLPLFDIPYNIAHGLRVPSMQQSLVVTEGFYEASHAGIQAAWGDRKWLGRASVALWDYFTLVLPFADAWLHEEFHRAVLGNRGIDSFNDVYRLDLGAEVIAVSHVRDEDLVRLKREHPAEQVRLGVAGIEGEYLLVERLEANRFFFGSRAWNLPLYWLVKLSSGGYVTSGTWEETNEDTDEMNREDGIDVEARDFTGHDFTAWVYDLHRPEEPYAARGVHPSGIGIDRYIKPADLTQEERDYLDRQGRLQLFNLLDPNLFGIHGVTVTSLLNSRPLRFNIRAGHVLTSFGHTVDANVFLKQDRINLFLVLHSYENGERRFPGVDARLLNYPVVLGKQQLEISPRLALWMQPEDQRFRTSAASAGGLAALRVHRSVAGRFGSWVEVEAKTAGWVAGNVHLDPNVSLRLGGSVALPRLDPRE